MHHHRRNAAIHLMARRLRRWGYWTRSYLAVLLAVLVQDQGDLGVDHLLPQVRNQAAYDRLPSV